MRKNVDYELLLDKLLNPWDLTTEKPGLMFRSLDFLAFWHRVHAIYEQMCIAFEARDSAIQTEIRDRGNEIWYYYLEKCHRANKLVQAYGLARDQPERVYEVFMKEFYALYALHNWLPAFFYSAATTDKRHDTCLTDPLSHYHDEMRTELGDPYRVMAEVEAAEKDVIVFMRKLLEWGFAWTGKSNKFSSFDYDFNWYPYATHALYTVNAYELKWTDAPTRSLQCITHGSSLTVRIVAVDYAHSLFYRDLGWDMVQCTSDIIESGKYSWLRYFPAKRNKAENGDEDESRQKRIPQQEQALVPFFERSNPREIAYMRCIVSIPTMYDISNVTRRREIVRQNTGEYTLLCYNAEEAIDWIQQNSGKIVHIVENKCLSHHIKRVAKIKPVQKWTDDE